MLLVGDIGGTKTVLALLDTRVEGALSPVREVTFASRDFQTFDALLDVFLQHPVPVTAACFGIAGPVIGQRCVTTNLPWELDSELLKQRLGTQQVRLLNDLEAMALGMLHLPDSELLDLNPGAQPQAGNRAVIAAGTGLGEAMLIWDGTRHFPVATEGGHCDFAAQTAQQDDLLCYLRAHFPAHVSYERILSGNGFGLLYDYLADRRFAPPCPAVPVSGAEAAGVDRNAVISQLGISGQDALCAEAVRLFVEIYGAEAGNLALKAMATGGVYIGGGIGPKIRASLAADTFMRAFTAKGRFRPLLSKMPVRMALNPKTPLIGCAHYFRDRQA